MNKTQVYTNIELSLIKDKIGMDKRKELTEINNVMRQFTEINPFAKYDDLMAFIPSTSKEANECIKQIASITSTFKVTNDFKGLFASDTLALKELIGLDTPSSLIRTMAEANRSILAMTAANMFVDSMAHSLREMESLRNTFDVPAMLSASLAAQSKLFELQRFPLGTAIHAAAPLQESLHLNLNDFTTNYKKLVDFTDHESSIIEVLEPDIIQYPSHEVFREAELLEQITVPEDEQEVLAEYEVIPIPEEKSLEDWLGEINSGFPSLLQGARAAVNTDNPDRARHVASSLRELIGHVLRQLAPEDKIRVWATDPSYYHNDRPTRRARLLYICKEINFYPLSEFVDADVKSAVTLIDALNAETHVILCRLTDQQLRLLVDRTELCLLFLLRLNSTNE